MTTAIVAAIITAGFLIAIWMIGRIVTTALTAATSTESTTAIATALSSTAEAVGASVAKALAPPEQVGPAAVVDEPEPWQDEKGDYDLDYVDGFEGLVGPSAGPNAVMAKEPKQDD